MSLQLERLPKGYKSPLGGKGILPNKSGGPLHDKSWARPTAQACIEVFALALGHEVIQLKG